MTLDEAITHAQERANQDCSECARDHQQLANWLIELKQLKEPVNKEKLDKLARNYTVEYLGDCISSFDVDTSINMSDGYLKGFITGYRKAKGC